MMPSGPALTDILDGPFAFARRLRAAIWVYDTDNKRVAYANAAACKLWGAETEAALKVRDLSIGMSTGVERRLKQYQTDFLAGHDAFEEIWTIHPHDGPVTLDMIYSGFELPDGRMGMLCEVIGQHNKDSDTLRSADALLHTDIIVVLFNLDGDPLYQNPAARGLFPLVNASRETLFLNPQDFNDCRAKWQKGEDSHVTAEIKTAKGPRWFDWSFKLCFDSVTREKSLLATGADVTQLKYMEDAFHMKQLQLEATFSTSQDGIFVIDGEGRVLDLNHQAECLFGYKRHEILGYEVDNLIVPKRYRQAHKLEMARLFENDESGSDGIRTEITVQRSNGEEFIAEVSISRSQNNDGDIFVVYIRDISAAKAAERALKEAKRRPSKPILPSLIFSPI